jgi:hypothetical protein
MDFSVLRKYRLFRIFATLFVTFLLIYFAVSGSARRRIRIIFSPSCIAYRQPVFSNRLTDRVVDYAIASRGSGIEACRDETDLKKMVREGKLVKVPAGRSFDIAGLTYSYPVLTPDARDLLKEIGSRFRERTDSRGLKGSKFTVTSMTRTTEKMKGLKRNNSNASVNSPHLNGNAFDISYLRFTSRKMFITECDKRYFKEVLAEVILELKSEKKCWATYEKNQSCYHVVAR